MEELIPYLEEEKDVNAEIRDTNHPLWPDWLRNENKLYVVKDILNKIIDSIEQHGLDIEKGFKVFDPENLGIINDIDFGKVLGKICPDSGEEL